MKAGFVIIGDELLAGSANDGHSAWLIDELSSAGVTVYETRMVGDDCDQIAQAVEELVAVCNLVIVTGGLGPTADDVTREALAQAGAGALVEDQQALIHLRERFRSHGRQMPEINGVQARRPEGMVCIDNTCGTAPGLLGQIRQAQVVALPGPTVEMQAMFHGIKEDILDAVHAQEVSVSAGVFAFGMPEAVAGQRLGHLMERDRMPRVGLTASNGILNAVARAQGPTDAAAKMVEDCVEEIQRVWSPWAFSCQGQSLAEVVGGLLVAESLTLSTAESCTGGWIGKAVVDQTGSSQWYRGGWVVYSNEMKSSQLGVDGALMQAGGPGAVSREVAAALASGACNESGSDLALSVTGIAGPDGGTPSKPVGTVFIGVCDRRLEEEKVCVRRFCFSGTRSQIRQRTVNAALQMCRFHLLEIEPPEPMLWEVSGSIAT